MDVPEMGYMTTDTPPRGEILVAGGNVSPGYYKLPDASAKAFRVLVLVVVVVAVARHLQRQRCCRCC